MPGDGPDEAPLYFHLFNECEFIQKLIACSDANEAAAKAPKGARFGISGHLTSMAATIQRLSQEPVSPLSCVSEEKREEVATLWAEFESTTLKEQMRIQDIQLVRGALDSLSTRPGRGNGRDTSRLSVPAPLALWVTGRTARIAPRLSMVPVYLPCLSQGGPLPDRDMCPDSDEDDDFYMMTEEQDEMAAEMDHSEYINGPIAPSLPEGFSFEDEDVRWQRR